MNALILTNGDYGDYTFCKKNKQYDKIICADNGMKHARKLNLLPDIIVGDFDSCNTDDIAYFEAKGVRILRASTQKDETDTELAIQIAVDEGATLIDVYGGVGSRMDHSLANIQLLYLYLKQGIAITLYSEKNKIQMMQNKITLTGEAGNLVSIMPFSEVATGVITTGLAYKIDGGSLKLGDAYGVSNYMLGNEASISIESGAVLVIQSRD